MSIRVWFAATVCVQEEERASSAPTRDDGNSWTDLTLGAPTCISVRCPILINSERGITALPAQNLPETSPWPLCATTADARKCVPEIDEQ